MRLIIKTPQYFILLGIFQDFFTEI